MGRPAIGQTNAYDRIFEYPPDDVATLMFSDPDQVAGTRVALLQTYKGEALGGDGTVPRMSAIPIELSATPASAVYAGTQHGSLQNAGAVLTHLTGLLSGTTLDLDTVRAPGGQVALEVEDVVFADEPIVVRARPSVGAPTLQATLWRSGETTPVATAALRPGANHWGTAEFAPPGAGAYRVTIEGSGVEPAEDALVVADVGGGHP